VTNEELQQPAPRTWSLRTVLLIGSAAALAAIGVTFATTSLLDDDAPPPTPTLAPTASPFADDAQTRQWFSDTAGAWKTFTDELDSVYTGFTGAAEGTNVPAAQLACAKLPPAMATFRTKLPSPDPAVDASITAAFADLDAFVARCGDGDLDEAATYVASGAEKLQAVHAAFDDAS
jgi:hypothetical protein